MISNHSPGAPQRIGRELAAVCCYFNPLRYQSRLQNYRRFVANFSRFDIPLITVELASGDQDFELPNTPHTIRLRSPDVLWQKERLLQLGFDYLARKGYRNAAWLDADTEFENPDWLAETILLLKQVPVCQLFEHVRVEMSSEGPHKELDGSVNWWLRTGEIMTRKKCPGRAWAANLDLLQTVPLYDRCIIGGGDRAFWLGCQCFGDERRWIRQVRKAFLWRNTNRRIRRDYLDWARRMGQAVQGRVGCVSGRITSYYHGDLENRRYSDRYRLLVDFDPLCDIQLNQDAVWQWASRKAHLHRGIINYLAGRQEDR